jgi:hypothetical protein
MSTVLEQMKGRQNRKCRGEALMRLLISTSYPQTVLSDLTFAFHDHAKMVDDQEDLAIVLRDVERSFDMFDFIRCIDIKRSGDIIQLVIKRLDIDPTARDIVDSPATHELMAKIEVKLPSPNHELEDTQALAANLLGIFHKSQVKVRRGCPETQLVNWKLKTRKLGKGRLPESPLDCAEAIAELQRSLDKPRFHIVLTQNTILLLDQQRRLWGQL